MHAVLCRSPTLLHPIIIGAWLRSLSANQSPIAASPPHLGARVVWQLGVMQLSLRLCRRLAVQERDKAVPAIQGGLVHVRHQGHRGDLRSARVVGPRDQQGSTLCFASAKGSQQWPSHMKPTSPRRTSPILLAHARTWSEVAERGTPPMKTSEPCGGRVSGSTSLSDAPSAPAGAFSGAACSTAAGSSVSGASSYAVSTYTAAVCWCDSKQENPTRNSVAGE